MLISGSCQKQNLMQAIRDAILSPGSNWVEISSNKTNDYKYTGVMNDGYVFKSPPIGTKAQSVFFNLKSMDLSIINPSNAFNNGANHFFMWLADDYIPNDSNGVNGVFTNKTGCIAWAFCQADAANCGPTVLFDYFIDIQDHRIMIIIQRSVLTATTYPQFLYVGYPEPSTNLEGANYTNQFILGSNIYNFITPQTGIGQAHWHKASNGNYGKLAVTNCSLNASNPNPLGLYLLSPIQITGDGGTGIPNTGVLGLLSGIYGLPSTNIVNGDIITIGGDTYQIFNLGQWVLNTLSNVGGPTTGMYYYNGIAPTIVAIKIN